LPSHWTRIDLQPRDLKLLRLLLEQKFLSHEQIVRSVFGGRERYTYLRVWKLRRFGFVSQVWVAYMKEGLFLATEQAFDYFRAQFVALPPPLGYPDARTISHDLLVSDIRFLFEELGFGTRWTSERMWRMGKSARLWAPDAIIHVGGDPFALEVERIQKMDARYEDIFLRYEEDSSISACLYVTTEELLETLLPKAEECRRIYFTTVGELFEKRAKAAFRNSRGHFLVIEENLEETLQKEPSG